MIDLQTPSFQETNAIHEALVRMLEYSPAPQMKLAEPATAYAHLHNARRTGLLFTYGDFAILIDVGSPWHTTKLVLIEEIIVRFRKGHGGTPEGAVAQLETLAKLHGCVAVAAGDTQIGVMAPRYIAAGFQPLGSQFYKEIP